MGFRCYGTETLLLWLPTAQCLTLEGRNRGRKRKQVQRGPWKEISYAVFCGESLTKAWGNSYGGHISKKTKQSGSGMARGKRNRKESHFTEATKGARKAERGNRRENQNEYGRPRRPKREKKKRTEGLEAEIHEYLQLEWM
jgi:hypothetical protein